MKPQRNPFDAKLLAFGLFIVGIAVLNTATSFGEELKAFDVEGIYVEGCNCDLPCPCELVALRKGCEGIGAIALTAGTFAGVDLSGAKVAHAAEPGNWVRLYVEAKSPEQRKAVEAFARAVFKAFGKIEAVKEARIDIAGEHGRYKVSVDDGKIMEFTTEPVLGGDKRNPVAHSNTQNALVSTFLQAKTIEGNFKDDDRSISLKEGNSYFNDKMKSSGKI